MIYQILADELLKLNDYTFVCLKDSSTIGFEYRDNYEGLMAKNPNRKKQGFFDIRVFCTRYDGHPTHRYLFTDLLQTSTLNHCLDVWRGKDPRSFSINEDEREILSILTLLMFEQEVNWGDEEWQKWTNFKPYQNTPNRRRPRDMIMGFLLQAFEEGVENLKYWMIRKPGTVSFSHRTESPFGYSTYPDNYKKYFTDLENREKYNGTEALMVSLYREKFRGIANNSPNNPVFRK